MNIEVINFRTGPFGTALAFFDVSLDDTFIVRGFALKQKKDGSSYYFQAPSKARTAKDGTPVKDKNGYQVYDAYFDLFGEKKDDKYTPSKAAWDGRDAIIEQAVTLFESGATANSGRGSGGASKPAKTAKVGAGKKAEQVEATDDADEDETDDLPF